MRVILLISLTRAYSTEVCHLFHLKPALQTGAKLPPNGT